MKITELHRQVCQRRLLASKNPEQWLSMWEGLALPREAIKMSFGVRVIAGFGAAVIGGLIGGPVVAYGAWKLAGAAVTGNPIYLIPGASLLGDSLTVSSDLIDFADYDGQGNPSDMNIQGNRPGDIQGHQGTWDVHGPSTDIHGRPV